MKQAKAWKRSAWSLAYAAAATVATQAHAGSFELGGDTTIDYKATANYGLAMRTEKQDNRLINGPVEEFQSFLNIPAASPGPGQPAQIFRFERQGLPISINSDDGNRNFDRGDLIHNRLSVYAEAQLHHGDYGAVLSGSAFYDDVYHHENANNSPETANVLNPDGVPEPRPSNPNYNKFTESTKYYDGERARLLEAYVYGSWYFGDESSVNVRLGQQLVAWGESLFMSGIASAQSQADATKAFVPGTEIKDILLPVPQVSFNAAVTNDLSVLGYYKFDFRPNEIFPVGDYFSPADVVGPGARFVFGSANPLGTSGCAGLITNLYINGQPTPAGPLVENVVCTALGLVGQTLLNSPDYIYTYREKDLEPSQFGQWGAGLRYQITSVTNVGLYHLRYHDPNPSVRLNVGYAPFGTLNGQPVTTEIIGQTVPVTYNVEYYDGIHMTAGSFSTVLGGVNVAGELNYRDGAPTAVETLISGHVSPVYSRSKSGQLLLSALYATNPRLWFDDLALVSEFCYLHMIDVDRVDPSLGIIPVGDGKKLMYDRDSYGIQGLAIPTRHNVFAGWDFSMPLTFGYLKGNPAIPGAMGALYGDGDLRASIGFSMTYLSNTQVGIGYNWFWGDAGKTINNTTLAANPYVDHDYATVNIKYNF